VRAHGPQYKKKIWGVGMIISRHLWIGLVAFLMPHEPDLGYGRPGNHCEDMPSPEMLRQRLWPRRMRVRRQLGTSTLSAHGTAQPRRRVRRRYKSPSQSQQYLTPPAGAPMRGGAMDRTNIDWLRCAALTTKSAVSICPPRYHQRGQFRGLQTVSLDNHPIHYDVDYLALGRSTPWRTALQVLSFTRGGAPGLFPMSWREADRPKVRRGSSCKAVFPATRSIRHHDRRN